MQTFVATGTNLTLQFCHNGLADEKTPDIRPSKESVDFDREPNRVHMQAKFIMNGVCVKWIGWIDLEQLTGKARLIFDEEQAKVGSCTAWPSTLQGSPALGLEAFPST